MFGESIDKVKEIAAKYYLEIIVAILSIASLFIDAGSLNERVYILPVLGTGVIAISTFQKIKGSRSFEEMLSSMKEKLDREEETAENLKEAHTLIRKKQEETEIRSTQLAEQNELVTRLVKEGLITEKSIYDILQKHRFFHLFCYQNIPEQSEVAEALGEQIRNPSLKAIDRIGFIRLGTKHNFYVLPYDMLPTSLRTPEKIEKLLTKLVEEEWSEFLEHMENKNLRFYKAYLSKHPTPANCSYFIASSNITDVIIDYVGYNAFSRAFKDLLHNKVNIKKLKKEIARKKHGIQKFVKSISIELLITDITNTEDRELITKNEASIAKATKVQKFTDYGKKKQELIKALETHFTKTKAKKYADLMSTKSSKYEELFALLGIDLD